MTLFKEVFWGPLDRQWVRLKELAELIGLSGEDVWWKYCDFFDERRWPFVIWSPDLKSFEDRGTPEDYESSEIYVPLSWAKDVFLLNKLEVTETRKKDENIILIKENGSQVIV